MTPLPLQQGTLVRVARAPGPIDLGLPSSVDAASREEAFPVGTLGVIAEYDDKDAVLPYRVRFADHEYEYWVRADFVVPIDDDDQVPLSDLKPPAPPVAVEPCAPSVQYPPPIPGNLYLHLYHGRTDPHQDMPDWGFDGPWIGPLEAVHGTYLSHVRLLFQTAEAAAPFTEDDELWLHWHTDMLEFGGAYYGDWTVTVYDPDKP